MYVYIEGTPTALDAYMHLHMATGPEGACRDLGSTLIGRPMHANRFCLSAEYTGPRTQFSV